MCVRRRLPLAIACALALAAGVRGAQPPADGPCSFPVAEIAWLQRALHGWEQVSRESLSTDPSPLPWVVLYDAACVWHLNPEASPAAARPPQAVLTFANAPVNIGSLPHNGTIFLPNGVPMAVEMKASTSLYRDGRAAFFAMAMPSVWQTRDVSGPTRAEYLQGVFSHEMTHIRLLVPINRRVRELARKHDLAYPINDDVIQNEFAGVGGFAGAVHRERDQFYRAALEPDGDKQRLLARRALGMLRQRRAKYFTGAKAAYAELESQFLLLEGVGQWAAYQVNKSSAGGNHAEVIRLVRDNRRYWSQDEGLAIFMLVDALVPGWQSRVFSPEPASPIALLEEALAPRGQP